MQVLQQIFAKVGNLYILLDVYNIFENLELVHAHYEVSTMRPLSHSRHQLPPTVPTISSHSSSRARLNKHEWELVNERCKELHEAGFIQPSSSDFIATTIMPTKKDLIRLWTKKRMCEDYRPLNLVAPQDRYLMPIPEKLSNSIGDSNIFTIMDLRQGFRLCSLRRITRKQHSMEATSFWNGL